MNTEATEKTSQEIETVVRKEFWINVGIVFACALVGLVGPFAPMIFHDAPDVAEKAIYWTIIGAALGALLIVPFRLSLAHQESLRMMNTIIRLRDDLATTASWAEKKHLLESMKDRAIGEACRELLEEYETVFDVSRSSLSLRDRKWSLHFNGIFWRSMIAHGKAKGITVLVTHTSGVENWEGPEAQDSLGEQREFTGQGNQIIRMFVDKDGRASDPIPDAYRKVMRDMEKNYGVDTVYVGARSLARIPDATWVLGLNIFMTWSGSNGEHFQIGSNPGELKTFKRRWRSHYGRAQSLDGNPSPLADAIIARLD